MHHKIQVLGKKHTYIVLSYRQATFIQKIFAVSLKNLFENILIFETISDKNCETRLPSPPY